MGHLLHESCGIAGGQLQPRGSTLGKYLESILNISGQGALIVQIDYNAILIAGSQYQTRDRLFNNDRSPGQFFVAIFINGPHGVHIIILLQTGQEMTARKGYITRVITFKLRIDRFVGIGRRNLHIAIQIYRLTHVHMNGIRFECYQGGLDKSQQMTIGIWP